MLLRRYISFVISALRSFAACLRHAVRYTYGAVVGRLNQEQPGRAGRLVAK